MKHCDSCGNETEEAVASCPAGEAAVVQPFVAGTLGETPSISREEAAPVMIRRVSFHAGRATLILLAYLTVQTLTGFLVGMVGGMTARENVFDARERETLTRRITPPAIVLGLICGGATMLLLSASLARGHLGDKSPIGAAWAVGAPGQIVKGVAVGALVGCFGLALTVGLADKSSQGQLGPIATMATSPGLPQFLWILSALVLAPPIEELLFRGVLYAGYRKSFGAAIAGVFTTLIFCVLHLRELIYVLPAAFGILGVAVAALWFRLRFAAIGPAIAVHFAYNAVVVCFTIYASGV